MPKARALDKRRRSIRNIRKITRTMELIATARFKKALDRATEAEAYTRRIAELAADLSASATNVTHPLLKEQVRDRFEIREGEPTVALDLVNDEDENGAVVKTAQQKLSEAVDEEIASGLKLMGELNPTRVRGQGATVLVEGATKGEGDDGEPDREGRVVLTVLHELAKRGVGTVG